MEIAPKTFTKLCQSRTILCYKKDSLPLPLTTICRIASIRRALRGACVMKKKRLGEILRERNQVSVENLDKAIQDQQVKLVHLGELLLQRGAVSKPDLVSALVEVSRIPYFDCHSVEVDAETLQLISATMARSCCALPLETVGNKLVVVWPSRRTFVFWTNCVSNPACKFRRAWVFAPKSKRLSQSTTRPRNQKPRRQWRRQPQRQPPPSCPSKKLCSPPPTRRWSSSPPARRNATSKPCAKCSPS